MSMNDMGEGVDPKFSRLIEQLLYSAMAKKIAETEDEETARKAFAKKMADTARDFYDAFADVGFDEEVCATFTDSMLMALMKIGGRYEME